ncbi:hypothetical protein ACW69C_22645 [Streptomyces sp. MN3]
MTSSIHFPARNPREWKALMASDSSEVSFIRSMEEWQQDLQRQDEDRNPVSRLPRSDIDAFTESLVFNKGGLAGGRYDVLTRTLTYDEFEVVLNRFGIDMSYFARDYSDVTAEPTDPGGAEAWPGLKNHKCLSSGTCEPAPGYYCTPNC